MSAALSPTANPYLVTSSIPAHESEAPPSMNIEADVRLNTKKVHFEVRHHGYKLFKADLTRNDYNRNPNWLFDLLNSLQKFDEWNRVVVVCDSNRNEDEKYGVFRQRPLFDINSTTMKTMKDVQFLMSSLLRDCVLCIPDLQDIDDVEEDGIPERKWIITIFEKNQAP